MGRHPWLEVYLLQSEVDSNMKMYGVFSFLFMFFLAHGTTITKHYIVYMGERSHPSSDAVIDANHVFLSSITGSTVHKAKEAITHHYSKSFRGFSAMLTPEQAYHLSETDGVVSVFESKTNPLHTTRSWDFLGLGSSGSQIPETFQNLIDDVIIGSIDSGVWPESESFKDDGLGPVPTRFKGTCVTGENFTLANCNRKIIGARFYYKGFEAENGPLEFVVGGTFFRSPRDADGHGTHTASTASGAIVPNASLLGIATGMARGGAIRARLAIYKACWFGLCSDADLLSAFDDATADGVDVISISAGPSPPQPTFFSDPISIGSFHAFKKGIVTSASAGNSGLPSTATNIAPWIITVAASSIDREFDTNLILGNSKIIQGRSLNPLTLEGSFGIIPASLAAVSGVSTQNASLCTNNTLDARLVKGKIVVCTLARVTDRRADKAMVVKEAGGVGMILIDPIAIDVGFQYVIPATALGQDEAQELQSYLASNNYTAASITRTVTQLGIKPAPEMAVFSSMGPSVITPDIIKPDVTAPGLNILAAWSPVALDSTGRRSVDYNIISGTSMSCPHVSGLAALVKSYHPVWSPAAVKSAIMTTATVLDNTKSTIQRDPNGAPTTPFDYGSGHIHPLAALNPGLVYDLDSNDIISFLCSNGATPAQLRNLTGELTTCAQPLVPSYNFNYPSIGVSNMKGSVSVYRTVSYYGTGKTVFKVNVDWPAGVNGSVSPTILQFDNLGEKQTYRIDFVPWRYSNGSFVFGAITWTDGRYYSVRSPIALNVVSV